MLWFDLLALNLVPQLTNRSSATGARSKGAKEQWSKGARGKGAREQGAMEQWSNGAMEEIKIPVVTNSYNEIAWNKILLIFRTRAQVQPTPNITLFMRPVASYGFYPPGKKSSRIGNHLSLKIVRAARLLCFM